MLNAVIHRLEAKSPTGKEPPEKLSELIRKAAGKALKSKMDENALYKLEGDDLGSKTAKALLRSVTVREGKLVVELGK